MFLTPFSWDAVMDPWVFVPIGVTTAYALYDYFSSKGNLSREPHQTPYSNFLYAVNYGVVQPFGSGVPEEMFFRGFLQNELYDMVPSPFFAIPIQAAAFAFAHGPGDGRLTAALVGFYLGYLAYRGKGDLQRGITVHYWGDLMLGIDTLLNNQSRQHATPPTSLYLQINY
jgi:membrane protease YdiL (CAAX protease family)